MNDHLVLLSGALSSILPRRYRRWANQLENTLRLPDSVAVWNLSSDGGGEKPALKAILADHRAKTLGRLAFAGHSNGARDILFMIETLYGMGIKVRYAACLDMTLGEFGCEAFGNIAFLDEFHARLQRVDFDESFKPSAANYKLWEINKGHVAMASDMLVQGRLRMKIEEAFR
jgi:hypothetical protein